MSALLDNPLFLGAIGTVVIAIFLLIFIRKGKPITEVIYCRERDRRGEDLRVTSETAQSLLIRRTGILSGANSFPLRFLKFAGSYVFRKGGKMITRFFGREGDAYTWWIGESGHKELGTISQTLRGIWGKAIYDQIPKDQRDSIETSKVFVTVNLRGGEIPEGLKFISEEDIFDLDDRKAATILGESMKKTAGRELYQGLLWAAAGFALCMICYQIGVFSSV